MLEKTLEIPLDRKKIQPISPKGNQPKIFTRRIDAKAETPILWLPDSLEENLMLGKMEGRRRRGWQRIIWLDSPTDSIDMNPSKFLETVKDREAWCAEVCGAQKSDMT